MPRSLDLELHLEHVTPRVWRLVRVRPTITLADLHHVIQVLMNWGDYHLHLFEVAGREYSPPPEDEAEVTDQSWAGDDREVTVGQAMSKGQGRIHYVYDFGDDWRLEINVTNQSMSSDVPYPECLDGELAGPPEDLGGPAAYQDLLERWRKSGRRGLDKELREWLPDGFDPFAFNVDEANLQLARAFGRQTRAERDGSPDQRLLADLTLLLLFLGSWRERDGTLVAAKTLRTDTLDELGDAGYLATNPHRKTVALSDQGVRRAEAIRARVAGLMSGPRR
jgi:hypothetical protein